MAADCILVITATQPRLAPLRGGASAIRSAIADYWALTKPEINLPIAIATSTGSYLATLPRFYGSVSQFRLLAVFILRPRSMFSRGCLRFSRCCLTCSSTLRSDDKHLCVSWSARFRVRCLR